MSTKKEDFKSKFLKELNIVIVDIVDIAKFGASETEKIAKKGANVAKKGAKAVKDGAKAVTIMALQQFEMKRIEKELKRSIGFYPILIRLVLPFVIGGATLFFLFPFYPEIVTVLLNSSIVYLLPFAGGFTSFFTIIASGVSPYVAGYWVLFMEFLVALFVLLNLNYLIKVPKVGKLILKAEAKGRAYLRKRTWARNAAFGGLLFFSSIPLPPLGDPFIGAILGKLLGMENWLILTAIVVGGVIRYGFLVLATIGVLAI